MLGPYCHDFGPIFPGTALALASKKLVFLRVVPYFGEPIERIKIQTTRKNSQRYNTTKRLIRYLLFNTPNCYIRAGEFRAGPLEYKYRVIFVHVFDVICILRSAVG